VELRSAHELKSGVGCALNGVLLSWDAYFGGASGTFGCAGGFCRIDLTESLSSKILFVLVGGEDGQKC